MKTILTTSLLVAVMSLALGLNAQETIYVTKTGEKYHRQNCRYLAQSSIAKDLSEAVSAGYTPCSVCKPTSTGQSTAPASSGNSGSTVQCSATTQAGSRCKRMTTNASGECWQHE